MPSFKKRAASAASGSKGGRAAPRAEAGGLRRLLKILALQFAAAAAVFCVLLVFRDTGNPVLQKGYDSVIKAFLYNIPVSDNDDDIGKIKFVDKIKENAVAADTLPLEFVLPVADGAAEVSSGVFTVTDCRGCVAVAPERGIVKSIGLCGGVKYIDIQHPGGILSRLQGIGTAGVRVNETVQKGAPVGVIADGAAVFCLFKDNRQLTAAVITDGRIEW